MIISSGMSSYSELDRVVRFYEKRSVPLVILYCVSEYPCPPRSFNLGYIDELQRRYPDHTIGFSDHSVDSVQSVLAAVARGASVIEKHFSFSREAWGSDHKASLLPGEYEEMVSAVRSDRSADAAEAYAGDPYAELPGADNQYRPFFLKSLVLKRAVRSGSVVKIQDFMALRPGAFAGYQL